LAVSVVHVDEADQEVVVFLLVLLKREGNLLAVGGPGGASEQQAMDGVAYDGPFIAAGRVDYPQVGDGTSELLRCLKERESLPAWGPARAAEPGRKPPQQLARGAEHLDPRFAVRVVVVVLRFFQGRDFLAVRGPAGAGFIKAGVREPAPPRSVRANHPNVCLGL